MEYVIQHKQPEAVFRFFEEISAIPRPSYHEGAIADYLVDFARKNELRYIQDALGNVILFGDKT